MAWRISRPKVISVVPDYSYLHKAHDCLDHGTSCVPKLGDKTRRNTIISSRPNIASYNSHSLKTYHTYPSLVHVDDDDDDDDDDDAADADADDDEEEDDDGDDGGGGDDDGEGDDAKDDDDDDGGDDCGGGGDEIDER